MKMLLLVILVLCLSECFSQRAGNVLEDGIVIKSHEKTFLQFAGDHIKYDIGKNSTDFITLHDSSIFLATRRGVNVYINPVNPLNYSYKTEQKIITDQINEEAGNVLTSVTGLIAKLQPTQGGASISDANADPCNKFDHLKKAVETIQVLLAKDKKDSVNLIFKMMKSLSFGEEKTTTDSIATINSLIYSIDQHYKNLEKALDNLRDSINGYDCPSPEPEPYIVKYIFTDVAKELTEVKNLQYKRLKYLQELFQLVHQAQIKASAGKDGLKWVTYLDEVPVNRGKITVYTIMVNESGYILSGKGEITTVETKEKIKRVIRFRNFERFIPEVSAGTAFTNLSFPKYGTKTDSVKNALVVANAGEELFKKINFTAMVNFNYFIPNSPLHPFLQIGIGANSDYPTFFSGAGFRLNVKPVKRFAFAFGMASTWIKTLGKLKVGDRVSGTAELEKDIKYEFKWPPKPYLGIQINF